jgi:hypothetical protein
MTGNTLTLNPITGTNAYANGAYGTPQTGFWGNTAGFGVNTPFGVTNPTFQTQVPSLFNQYGTFTPQAIQPGIAGLPVNQWQTGYTPFQQFGITGIQNPMLQTTQQQVVNQLQQQSMQQALAQIQQTCPPQVLNTILQTCAPQVLPYVLNALACQQTCQQVLAQNPQAAQAITQPFTGINQPVTGQFGITGFGQTPTQFQGYQPQFAQGACVGCTPGTQQWGQTLGVQGGFGQFQPQQPWFATSYGTW